MDNSARHVINDLFADVLEQLVFIFAEPAPKAELPTNAESVLQVNINFTGHMSGKLVLMSPESVCAEMAMNMLGANSTEEISAADAHEAIKELVNISCGQLLTALAGNGPVFDLSPPDISRPDSTAWMEMLNDEQTFGYFTDGGPLLLRFLTNQAA